MLRTAKPGGLVRSWAYTAQKPFQNDDRDDRQLVLNSLRNCWEYTNAMFLMGCPTSLS